MVERLDPGGGGGFDSDGGDSSGGDDSEEEQETRQERDGFIDQPDPEPPEEDEDDDTPTPPPGGGSDPTPTPGDPSDPDQPEPPDPDPPDPPGREPRDGVPEPPDRGPGDGFVPPEGPGDMPPEIPDEGPGDIPTDPPDPGPGDPDQPDPPDEEAPIAPPDRDGTPPQPPRGETPPEPGEGTVEPGVPRLTSMKLRRDLADQLPGVEMEHINVFEEDGMFRAEPTQSALAFGLTTFAAQEFEEPEGFGFDFGPDAFQVTGDNEVELRDEFASFLVRRQADLSTDDFGFHDFEAVETDEGFRPQVREGVLRGEAMEELGDLGQFLEPGDIVVERSEREVFEEAGGEGETRFETDVFIQEDARREALIQLAASDFEDFGPEDIRLEATRPPQTPEGRPTFEYDLSLRGEALQREAAEDFEEEYGEATFGPEDFEVETIEEDGQTFQQTRISDEALLEQAAAPFPGLEASDFEFSGGRLQADISDERLQPGSGGDVSLPDAEVERSDDFLRIQFADTDTVLDPSRSQVGAGGEQFDPGITGLDFDIGDAPQLQPSGGPDTTTFDPGDLGSSVSPEQRIAASLSLETGADIDAEDITIEEETVPSGEAVAGLSLAGLDTEAAGEFLPEETTDIERVDLSPEAQNRIVLAENQQAIESQLTEQLTIEGAEAGVGPSPPSLEAFEAAGIETGDFERDIDVDFDVTGEGITADVDDSFRADAREFEVAPTPEGGFAITETDDDFEFEERVGGFIRDEVIVPGVELVGEASPFVTESAAERAGEAVGDITLEDIDEAWRYALMEFPGEPEPGERSPTGIDPDFEIPVAQEFAEGVVAGTSPGFIASVATRGGDVALAIGEDPQRGIPAAVEGADELAESFVESAIEDPVRTGGALAGGALIGTALSPVRFGRAKLPTSESGVTGFTGVRFQTPLAAEALGVTPRSTRTIVGARGFTPSLGAPRVDLGDIDFRRTAERGRELEPRGQLETEVIGESVSQLEATQAQRFEVARELTDLGESTRGGELRIDTTEDLVREVRAVPEGSVGDIADVMREFDVTVKGSASQRAQLPEGTGRTPRDIDVIVDDPGAFRRAADEVLEGENAATSDIFDIATSAEFPDPGDVVKFGQRAPRRRRLDDGVEVTSLGEEFLRKSGASAFLRDVGVETGAIDVGPQPVRPGKPIRAKDPADALRIGREIAQERPRIAPRWRRSRAESSVEEFGRLFSEEIRQADSPPRLDDDLFETPGGQPTPEAPGLRPRGVFDTLLPDGGRLLRGRRSTFGRTPSPSPRRGGIGDASPSPAPSSPGTGRRPFDVGSPSLVRGLDGDTEFGVSSLDRSATDDASPGGGLVGRDRSPAAMDDITEFSPLSGSPREREASPSFPALTGDLGGGTRSPLTESPTADFGLGAFTVGSPGVGSPETSLPGFTIPSPTVPTSPGDIPGTPIPGGPGGRQTTGLGPDDKRRDGEDDDDLLLGDREFMADIQDPVEGLLGSSDGANTDTGGLL